MNFVTIVFQGVDGVVFFDVGAPVNGNEVCILHAVFRFDWLVSDAEMGDGHTSSLVAVVFVESLYISDAEPNSNCCLDSESVTNQFPQREF